MNLGSIIISPNTSFYAASPSTFSGIQLPSALQWFIGSMVRNLGYHPSISSISHQQPKFIHEGNDVHLESAKGPKCTSESMTSPPENIFLKNYLIKNR
jgi:hypothetical protein